VLDFLFVYGTLRSEFENPHARRLRAEARPAGPATVLGSIFRIAHYPGYRPEPAGEVDGELWQLNDPETTLAALDAWEGPEYVREQVRLTSGQTAWIYRFATQPSEGARIASGNFCAP